MKLRKSMDHSVKSSDIGIENDLSKEMISVVLLS